MKRCKNCKMWNRFQGDEPTVPARSPNACTLRLFVTTNRNNERILVPSRVRDHEKGEHFGVRTKPNFVCKYHVPLHEPYKRPVEAVGSEIAGTRAEKIVVDDPFKP